MFVPRSTPYGGKSVFALILALLTIFGYSPIRLLAGEAAPRYRPAQAEAAAATVRAAGGPEEDLRVYETAKLFGIPSAAAVLASPGTKVGETYYDYQHNGSTGRQVGKFGNNIQVTYMKQNLPQLAPGRKVYWNRVGVTGSPASFTLDNGNSINRLPLGAPATPLGIEVGPEDQQGYTNLSLLPNGRAAAFFHAVGALGTWAVAMDSTVNSGRFKYPDYEYPAPKPPPADPAIWPHGVTDVVGTDTVLHVVAMESNTSGTSDLYYWRGVVGHPGGPFVTVTWADPVYIADLSTSTAVVESDPTSDRVAIVYASPRALPIDNDFDCDVAYRVSTNGGLSWGSPVNITNYTPASEQRAHADVAAAYDLNGTLHIVYNTTRWFFSGYTSYLPVMLWHWDNVSANSKMITAAYWKNTCSDSYPETGGGYNLQLAKPTISVKPAGAGPGAGNPDEVLYVAWVQFGPTQTDCATYYDGTTPGGQVNSEIWCSASDDDGLSWDTPQNVTGTETPNCTLGDCHSEHWVTAAALADSGVYLSYVDDTHAGGISQSEGGWSLSPYKVLALEARAPSVSPRLVVLPVEPANWTSFYWNNEIRLMDPPAGVTTDQISIANPGTAQLNFTATIVNNGPASSNPLVNGVAVYSSSIALGGAAENLTISYDPAVGGYLNFDLEITSNAAARARSSSSVPFLMHWNWGVAGDQYWHPLGAGINGYPYTLAEYNNKLIAGGGFSAAGGNAASNIASWDGVSWSPLGLGTNSTVTALTVYNGKLIAGGQFNAAGGNAASTIASWDGVSWGPLGLGTNSNVNALTVYNGKLIAGGGFSAAGGNSANYIASWDGVSWSPLGSGMNNAVTSLAVYGSKLIAGGYFTTAGGNAASNIASWDGVSWSPLGLGTNSTVFSLTVYDGKLIAGGQFNAAGGNSANYIASWDGVSWGQLGLGTNSTVMALTVYDDKLNAGGYFSTAGGDSASAIASWDGVSWSPLGSGANMAIRDLLPFVGKLYAGGFFSIAGNKNAVSIAAWAPPLACPITLTGDLDQNGFLQSADVIRMVNYVFKSGATPVPCEAAGDADCSGAVQSADIIRMVNHVFKSGIAPCNACTSTLAAGC